MFTSETNNRIDDLDFGECVFPAPLEYVLLAYAAATPWGDYHDNYVVAVRDLAQCVKNMYPEVTKVQYWLLLYIRDNYPMRFHIQSLDTTPIAEYCTNNPPQLHDKSGGSLYFGDYMPHLNTFVAMSIHTPSEVPTAPPNSAAYYEARENLFKYLP
jgi:hypothetical protein